MNAQVTIKDIARELEISPSTVSRALKDHPDISPKTKKAVNDLAEKLHYQPNSIALSLRKSKTYTIGIIIPEFVHFFFSTVISGIEDVAYEKGYNVIISQSSESYEREVSDTRSMISHRVDGLLVSMSKETRHIDHFKELVERGIPLVFFDRICPELKTDRVIIDDFEAGFKAVEHLISTGKRRIAHLYGDLNLLICKNRYDGYRSALEKYGLPFDEKLASYAGMLELEPAKALMHRLLALPEMPDAVFAHNDVVAYGAMLAIKERGIKIPEECAVIGFSDWQFSSFVEPGLSTISQSEFEMGQEAARLFLDQIENGGDSYVPQTKVIPTRLVIRGSTMKS